MSTKPIRWNTSVSQIPNHVGARIHVLAKAVNSLTEYIYIVAKDGDGCHYLSTDGTLAGALPFHLVVAWRPE